MKNLAGEQLRPAGPAVRSGEVDVSEEREDEIKIRPDARHGDSSDAELENRDEEIVDGEVKEEGGGGAVGEWERDGLSAEEYAHRMEETLKNKVGEGSDDVVMGDGGYGLVLPAEHQNMAHAQPEDGDGEGDEEEEENCAL